MLFFHSLVYSRVLRVNISSKETGKFKRPHFLIISSSINTLLLFPPYKRRRDRGEISTGMNQVINVYIAGFSISFIIAALNGVAYFYFLYLTNHTIKALNQEALHIKRSKFHWIYLISFGTSIGMGLLYLIQYYGQGMAMKPNLLFVMTWRWLFIGVIGAFYMGLLSCVLSSGSHHPGQAVFSIFLILLTFLSLYIATISESESLQIVWSTFTIVWFALDWIVLFLPHSLVFHHWREARQIAHSEPSVWVLMFRPIKEESKEASLKLWSAILPLVLFLQMSIACLGYIITWYLSDGNEFTDVSNFKQTNIANLVFDVIFLFPLWFVVACLTFHGFVEKVAITDPVTNHQYIRAVPLYENSNTKSNQSLSSKNQPPYW